MVGHSNSGFSKIFQINPFLFLPRKKLVLKRGGGRRRGRRRERRSGRRRGRRRGSRRGSRRGRRREKTMTERGRIKRGLTEIKRQREEGEEEGRVRERKKKKREMIGR